MPERFSDIECEEREAEPAAREAALIGGPARDEDLDPAQRTLVEAGECAAEGFGLPGRSGP